jgi:hypothetical protein
MRVWPEPSRILTVHTAIATTALMMPALSRLYRAVRLLGTHAATVWQRSMVLRGVSPLTKATAPPNI